METIRVNMTPCEDVKTIHASQNDNEAREWGFELHNNGEKIDSSSISDQLVFKAYKGGTEQLLPENTSTPTTSPFLGDIKYPQGLLSDQEFLYRQSPTEEDGLAKITDIKGNTLVWNQLVQNGNFADTSLWRTYSSTGFSVSNNVGSFTVTGSTGAIYQTNTPTYVSGHKYLVIADFYVSQQSNISVEVSGTRGKTETVNANTWYRYSDIVAPSAQGNFSLTCGQASVQVKNVMCFDLTQMGLDISSPSDFTSLFSLPYYAYNQGTLLSFNGNGIKTVGKNQSQLVSMSTISGGYINASSGDIATVKKGITYTLSFDNLTSMTSNVVARILADGAWVRQGEKNLVANSRWSLTFTATDDGALGLSAGLGSQYSEVKVFDNIQLELGSTATSYEPYTSSTSSLPISTYFPTGMKSALTVYDELTPLKAITRIGSVDLGTLDWSYLESVTMFMTSLPSMKETNNKNIICPIYQTVDYWVTSAEWANNNMIMTRGGNDNNIRIKNTSYNTGTAFKTAMSGVYLYYELETETETSFTTASLVTENAEIPLSNEDGTLIGKCTEQLSENPGFIDAKIKLADADGECYSNKIQLHVERSPQ